MELCNRGDHFDDCRIIPWPLIVEGHLLVLIANDGRVLCATEVDGYEAVIPPNWMEGQNIEAVITWPERYLDVMYRAVSSKTKNTLRFRTSFGGEEISGLARVTPVFAGCDSDSLGFVARHYRLNQHPISQPLRKNKSAA